MNRKSESEQLERIQCLVFDNADEACRQVADAIESLIRERTAAGKKAVLGLATGSTPVKLYRELIRRHRENGLSFKSVITFNLDEYYGLTDDHPESYHRFMREQLFNHIDIDPANTNLLSGIVERKDVFEACLAYEEKIAAAGGIDIQILGIGRTGHIGFNEPGSTRDSRTRLVPLDSLTRRDAARDFLGEENVPRYAITMGVGTILDAKSIYLLAWGESKADVIAKAVEGTPTESLPASLLQGHPNVRFMVDKAAASQLTRFKHPWRVSSVRWTPALARQAVQWLSLSLNKPILKLVDSQYSEHGMAELLTEQGPAYDLNIRIFNETQHTITGWPGGKPNADDSNRPERASPHPKRVLIFSPEPQDDVVCMGGTLNRLIRQGHDVSIAYMTSGNLAVSDEEVIKAVQLILDLEGIDPEKLTGKDDNLAVKVYKQLQQKGPFDLDTPDIRKIKGLIRRGEARAAGKLCGVQANQISFLDLPFYENGRYRQFRLTDVDVEIIRTLLDKVKPHQIYATGNLADPTSVQAICFEALQKALATFDPGGWKRDCYVWLYRGAGREWEPHEIDMAVPLSPEELAIKIQATYQHQSQRSQTPLTADNHRELWQQAELVNRSTAITYDRLGLAEYEAIEAFKRWKH